jgi:hypothetical protein
VRAAIALGLLASLAVGCGSAKPPPSGDAASASAVGTSSDGATASVGDVTSPDTSPEADQPPNLLIAGADGSFSIVDPLRPTERRALRLPEGTGGVTTGPTSIAAYTTDPSKATRIVLGPVIDDALIADTTITAPAGERWGGTYPACINGAGLVILADAGLRLSLTAPGEDISPLPDQRSNLGHCVWLDDGHVVWDEEGGGLAMLDLDSEQTIRIQKSPIVRDPSGGAGRIAGLAADGSLVVTTDQLDGVNLTLDPSARIVAGATAGQLTADGRWLLARTAGGVVVTREGADPAPPSVTIAVAPTDRVSWLPSPGP